MEFEDIVKQNNELLDELHDLFEQNQANLDRSLEHKLRANEALDRAEAAEARVAELEAIVKDLNQKIHALHSRLQDSAEEFDEYQVAYAYTFENKEKRLGKAIDKAEDRAEAAKERAVLLKRVIQNKKTHNYDVRKKQKV